MNFTPDPFIASLFSELATAGFYNTALEGVRRIGDGKNGKAFDVEEQEAIVADVIQHNIIFPYEAWRRIIDLRDKDEKEVSEEHFLMVLDDTGVELPLGSPDYGPFIARLRTIVKRLRSGPPSSDPSPGRGGAPPSGPAPIPTMAPKPSHDQSAEKGDVDVPPTRRI